jgi:hypothetical protein
MTSSQHRPARVAVLGVIAAGFTIALSNFAVVRAERATPDGSKSYKCSGGTACLQAKSSSGSTDAILATNTSYGNALVGKGASGFGVYGTSSSSAGVVGMGLGSGVFGESTGSGGAQAGVYGYEGSGANIGVEGFSGDFTAIYGETNNGSGAIFGANNGSGDGVAGEAPSSGGTGVYGFGSLGAEAEGTGTALFAQGDTSSTFLLLAQNIANNTYCQIDPAADLQCSGVIQGGALRTRHRSSTGERVLAYAAESATATIDDVGRGRLLGGLANVQIPSDFASVTDRSDYYVFLTPMGDTRGLYVSMQTPSAFQVRENERGRSNAEFEYRIVARPIDESGDRLPPALRIRRPHISRHQPLQPLPLPQLPKVNR